MLRAPKLSGVDHDAAPVGKSEELLSKEGLLSAKPIAQILQNAKGTMSKEDRAILKQRLLSMREKLWEQHGTQALDGSESDDNDEEEEEEECLKQADARFFKRKLVEHESPREMSASKRPNFGNNSFSSPVQMTNRSIMMETPTTLHNYSSTNGSSPAGQAWGKQQLTQQPRATQVDIARRVMQTLGKMSTPLQEVRARRPPSWATPSLVTASKSPNVFRLGQAPSQSLRREPPLPRNSFENAPKISNSAFEESKSITEGHRSIHQISSNSVVSRLGRPKLPAKEAKQDLKTNVPSNKRVSEPDPVIQTNQVKKPSPPRQKEADTNVVDTRTSTMQVSKSSVRAVISGQVNTRFVFTPPGGSNHHLDLGVVQAAVQRSSYNFDSPIEDPVPSPRSSSSKSQVAETKAPIKKGFESLGLKQDQWKCETCWSKNSIKVDECASCEAPRPKTSGAPPTSAKSPPSSQQEPQINSNSNTQKDPPPIKKGFETLGMRADQWKCDTCLCKNSTKVMECAACEAPRPGASKTSSSSSSLKEKIGEKDLKATPFTFGVSKPEGSNKMVSFAKSSSEVEKDDSNTKTPFTFGSSSTPEITNKPSTESTPLFSQSKPNTEKQESGFSFGVPPTKNESSPFAPIPEGDIKEKSKADTKVIPFKFGGSDESKKETAPAFTFGSSDNSKDATNTLNNPEAAVTSTKPQQSLFGDTESSKADPPSQYKPFIFGEPAKKPTTISTPSDGGFTFGAAPEIKKDDTNNKPTSVTTSEKPAIELSNPFGSSDPKPSTTLGTSGFTFGSSSKETQEEPKAGTSSAPTGFVFGAGANEPKPEVKGFSFGSQGSAQPESSSQQENSQLGSASKQAEKASAPFVFGANSSSAPATAAPPAITTSIDNPFASNSSSTTAFGGSSASSSAFGSAGASKESSAPNFGGITSNPFGSGSTSAFGSSENSAQQSFGAGGATNGSAVFGSQNNSTPTASTSGFAFGGGASTSGPTTAAFGGTDVKSSTSASAGQFGGASSTGSNPFGGSAFSATSNQTPAFGGSSSGAFGAAQDSKPFGGSVAQAGAAFAFGSNNTSNPSATATNPFRGTVAPAQSQTAFGAQGGAFGSSMPNQNAFGSSGGFGASQNGGQQQSFGAPAQPQGGAFGGQNQNSFGSTNGPQAFGGTPTTGFGASQSTSFGFGGTQAAAPRASGVGGFSIGTGNNPTATRRRPRRRR